MHAALCSYGGRVPDVARIPTRLRRARFKSPRFAPWAHLANSTILPEAAAKLLSKRDHEQHHQSNMHEQHPASQKFLLRCHSCNATSDMQQRTLYRHGKCIHITCKFCKKGASAAKWFCKCGTAWIACPLCRSFGFSCQSRRLKRALASLATIGTIPHPQPPPPEKAPPASPGFCGFSGSGQTSEEE